MAVTTPDTEFDFEVDEWPFYWLAKADRAYLARLEVVLAKVDLDIPRWRVLMVLHGRTRASVSELAEHSIVKLSTMTKIIQRMEADDLVSTAPSERDARVTEVTISQKGELAGAKAWKEANGLMQEGFAKFTKAEIKTLTKLLKKLTLTMAP